MASPSRSASKVASSISRCAAPGVGGTRKTPRSSRLWNRHSPVPSKQNQRSATPSPSDSNHLTITLAVHPFVGQRFRITRRLRGSMHAPGQVHFEVEGPNGHSLRVPIGWTDRGLGPAPGSRSEPPRVGATQLLALTHVVEEIRAMADPRGTLGDDASTTPPSPPDRPDGAPVVVPPRSGEPTRDRGTPRVARRGPRPGGQP